MKNIFRIEKKLLTAHRSLLPVICSLLPIILLTSCGTSSPVVIWTDRPEIVSYVEFFNVAQNKAKAVVVYKEKLASALPPAKDEQNPDLVIGSFLRNSRIKKNFASLNRVFNRSQINPASIYEPLLEYGKFNGRQYLIPVSFNLPTMIFSQKNYDLIQEDMLVDSDTIRDSAGLFNQKSEHDVFVKMGYAPSWDANFIFHVAKMNGIEFTEKGNIFSWNSDSLNSTIDYIKNWSRTKNGGTSAEQDFSFKYLYAPAHKLINSDRCLFAYIKSNDFFNISSGQTENIAFHWLGKDEKIFVNDDMTSLGLYRKTKNASAAYEFINWFFTESTQRNLLERAMRMNLDTQTFGICSGFSSIKSVNERVFPSFYKTLLGKMPSESALVAPLPLPARWESLKERVIIPYLSEATNTDNETAIKSVEERIAAWRNQFN
ncbi:MAG: hypothetical protein IJP90_06585 [Treponema sp.]|nr:hypothetical protein [Treponema sp.]